MSIRWPKAIDSSAFRAQTLPDSTTRVDITVRNGSSILASRTVTRTAGQPVSTVTLKLPVATGLQIDVNARPSGGSTAIATGTGTVNISAGQTSSVAVTLSPQFVPSITALSPSLAKVGDTITLTGSDLGPAWLTGNPTILFTGTSASVSAIATAVNVGSLTLDVPSGAKSGAVEVLVDGVLSSNTATFALGGALTVSAAGVFPTSTATYRATVKKGATTIATSAETAAGAMPIQLTIPQDSGLSVTLDALPTSNRPAANGGATSQGTTAFDMSNTAARTEAVTLAALYRPAIDSFNPTSNSAGSAQTINGTNLKNAWASGNPTVSFAKTGGGTTSGTVTGATNTSITVTIPSDATTGNVVVTHDGLASVGSSLTVTAPNAFNNNGTYTSLMAGSFLVNASDTVGALLHNLKGNNVNCSFQASGTWSYDGGTTSFGPDGNTSLVAGSTYLRPGDYAGSLVSQRSNGSFETIGAGTVWRQINANDFVRYFMNDVIGEYGNNQGNVTVSWSCSDL